MNVAAVIVTRGNVDLAPCIATYDDIPLWIWDNSKRATDLAVYGRYAAIEEMDADVVIVQDDDVILPDTSIAELVAAYTPGHIVANQPERFRPHYPDSCLVGFGAIFDRDLPAQAFATFKHFGPDGFWLDDFYRRTCDVVFTTLTPRVLLDLPYADREFASDPDRMWKQPGHVGERARMLELARQVRDRVPA